MARPRLVYDDDCGFCTWSADFADRNGNFELVGFSDLSPELREQLPDDYETCVHLVVDSAVYSCGEATERILVRCFPALEFPISILRCVPGYADLRERLYRWAADRRALWGKIVSKSSV